MQDFIKNLKKNLDKNVENHQVILGIIFILYLVTDIQSPKFLVNLLNKNIFMHGIVYLLALSVFLHSSPVIGLLALIVAHQLIQRSEKHVFYEDEVLPKRDKNFMTPESQFPMTLEEEVVSKMAPLTGPEQLTSAKYQPVLNQIDGGSPIDYEGVI